MPNSAHDPFNPETATQTAIAQVGPQPSPVRGSRSASPLEDWLLYVVVFIGGCLGTALRYGISLLIPRPLAETGFFSAFHTATFAANMIACFVYAWLAMLMSQSSWLAQRTRSMVSHGVGMGMCGGFSTLSALVIEELMSFNGGDLAGVVFYEVMSFACGLLVAFGGTSLALRMTARRKAREVEETVSRQTTVEEAEAAADAFLAAHPAEPVVKEHAEHTAYPWVAADATGTHDSGVGAIPMAADTSIPSLSFPSSEDDDDFNIEREILTDEIPVVEMKDAAAVPAQDAAEQTDGSKTDNTTATVAVEPAVAEPVTVETQPEAKSEPALKPSAEPDCESPRAPEPRQTPAPAPVKVPQVVEGNGDAPSFGRIVDAANQPGSTGEERATK